MNDLIYMQTDAYRSVTDPKDRLTILARQAVGLHYLSWVYHTSLPSSITRIQRYVYHQLRSVRIEQPNLALDVEYLLPLVVGGMPACSTERIGALLRPNATELPGAIPASFYEPYLHYRWQCNHRSATEYRGNLCTLLYPEIKREQLRLVAGAQLPFYTVTTNSLTEIENLRPGMVDSLFGYLASASLGSVTVEGMQAIFGSMAIGMPGTVLHGNDDCRFYQYMANIVTGNQAAPPPRSTMLNTTILAFLKLVRDRYSVDLNTPATAEMLSLPAATASSYRTLSNHIATIQSTESLLALEQQLTALHLSGVMALEAEGDEEPEEGGGADEPTEAPAEETPADEGGADEGGEDPGGDAPGDEGGDTPDEDPGVSDTGDETGGGGTDTQSTSSGEPTPTVNSARGVTFKIAEPETFDTYLFRSEVANYLTALLENPPEDLSGQKLQMLRKLKSHWLYILSVRAIVDLLEYAKLPVKFEVTEPEEPEEDTPLGEGQSTETPTDAPPAPSW